MKAMDGVCLKQQSTFLYTLFSQMRFLTWDCNMKHSPRLINSSTTFSLLNFFMPNFWASRHSIKRTSTQEIAWFQPTPWISTTSLQDGLFYVHVKLLELVKEFSNHWQGSWTRWVFTPPALALNNIQGTQPVFIRNLKNESWAMWHPAHIVIVDLPQAHA